MMSGLDFGVPVEELGSLYAKVSHSGKLAVEEAFILLVIESMVACGTSLFTIYIVVIEIGLLALFPTPDINKPSFSSCCFFSAASPARQVPFWISILALGMALNGVSVGFCLGL